MMSMLEPDLTTAVGVAEQDACMSCYRRHYMSVQSSTTPSAKRPDIPFAPDITLHQVLMLSSHSLTLSKQALV